MYKTAFKKGTAPIKPADVGDLYMTYCKKNMRSGSTKSMDDLCAPIVKKVETKMSWVPPTEEVTPELVCKTVDQIKALYPDHAATVATSEVAAKKKSDADEEDKKKLAELAKTLGGEIQSELAEYFKKASEVKEVKARLTEKVKTVLGGDFDKSKEKIVDRVLETVTLGIKGLETKSKQKTDESLKEWLVSESKEMAKKRKEKAEL